jgi:hypothetical protein
MILATDIIGSQFKKDEIVPFLVEVKLPEPTQNSFLRIRETLTRVGVASARPNEDNTLYQTCNILSKRGKFYIVHFKALFILEGRDNALTVSDISRSNMITQLLQDWGLLTIVNPKMIEGTTYSMSNIKVVHFSEKDSWTLKQKYAIGARVKQQKEMYAVNSN